MGAGSLEVERERGRERKVSIPRSELGMESCEKKVRDLLVTQPRSTVVALGWVRQNFTAVEREGERSSSYTARVWVTIGTTQPGGSDESPLGFFTCEQPLLSGRQEVPTERSSRSRLDPPRLQVPVTRSSRCFLDPPRQKVPVMGSSRTCLHSPDGGRCRRMPR